MLDEAVAATLELESYLTPKLTIARVEVGTLQEEETTIGVVSSPRTDKDSLTTLVDKLINRMDKLKMSYSESETGRQWGRTSYQEREPRRGYRQSCHWGDMLEIQ